MKMIAGRKNGFWELRSFCKRASEFYEAKKDEVKLSRDKAELLALLSDARRIMADLGDAKYADRLAEVRRVREEHAAEFNYDIDAIFADYKRLEAESERAHVSFGPRRIDKPAPSSEPVPNATAQ